MIYHCDMDDGKRVSPDVTCAADDIQAALEQHRGHRVVKCFRGDGRAGITYDVPPHEPLPPAEKRKKTPDPTSPMFDEAAIKAESRVARERTAPQSED